jgi:hypothetical protein
MSASEANRLVSFGLVVLIWLVQLIIYPSFGAIDAARFIPWHAGYTRTITWIVAPLMFAQAGLLAWLLLTVPTFWRILAFCLVAIAWLTTFGLSVPIHEALPRRGRNEELIGRLIATNWIRTFAWTLAFLASLAD